MARDAGWDDFVKSVTRALVVWDDCRFLRLFCSSGGEGLSDWERPYQNYLGQVGGMFVSWNWD